MLDKASLNGIKNRLESILISVINICSKSVLLLYCAITTRLNNPSENFHPMIILRKGQWDTITVSLLSQLNKLISEKKLNEIVFVVDNESDFKNSDFEPLNQYVSEDLIHTIYVVEHDTIEFVKKIKECNTIILTAKGNICSYRFFMRRTNKLLLQLYHGPITKSQGNLTKNKMEEQARRGTTSIDLYPYGVNSFIDRLDVKSVSSEIKRHFHSAAEARSPGKFKIWGYPRFDRINELKDEQSANPIIPKESKQKLDNDDSELKILYAPTGRSKENMHPFRLNDFKPNVFKQTLEELNIDIYVRMHYDENVEKNHQDILGHNKIKNAGYSFSPSSVEILNHFDAIITDYSSIYIEFLKFNRPILFIDDLEEFEENNKGIAFEYNKFFPGPKIKDFNDLIDNLHRLSEGIDKYDKDRECVEEVILPKRNYDFVNNMYEEWENIK